MKFLILNRTGDTSYYKRALHEVLRTKGNTLLLGYGYISEKLFNNNPELLNSISEGFSNMDKEYKQIILVGSKTDDYTEFKNVAQKIHNHDKNIEIKLIIKKANQFGSRKYHKKIAMKYDRAKNDKSNTPIIALLGSSNCTCPAYDDGLDKNQELDLLIWNPFIIDLQEEVILDNIELNKDFIECFDKNSELQRKSNTLLKSSTYKIDFKLSFQLEEIIKEIDNFEHNNFFIDSCLVDFSHVQIKDFFSVNTNFLTSLTNSIIIKQLKDEIIKNKQDYKKTSDHVSMIYSYFKNYLAIVESDLSLDNHQDIINTHLKFLEEKGWNQYIKRISREPLKEETKDLISYLKEKKIEGTTLYDYLFELPVLMK